MNKFVFYKDIKEEIEDKNGRYANYDLITSWEDPDNIHKIKVRTRSDNKFTLRDCIDILHEKLEVGNQKQIEALRALELINIYYIEHKYYSLPQDVNISWVEPNEEKDI